MRETAKESKEKIRRLTQDVLPSVDLRRSRNLLKLFRDLKYPEVGIREIAVKVLEDPVEYLEFCEAQILKSNKLEESAFNHLLNQSDNLNLEQIEILINRLLMTKINILHLIEKNKDEW